MTLHFQDDVATNLLTIDATDPKSGTAEFKATAIRIEKSRPRSRSDRRHPASGSLVIGRRRQDAQHHLEADVQRRREERDVQPDRRATAR